MISRRQLAAWLASTGAAVAVGAPGPKRLPARRRPTPALLKPPPLAPGELVGLVAPASLSFEASTVDLAREQLQAIGLRVLEGAHVRARHGYFAGTDQQRADDLMAMFTHPEVRGIFALRGGWGTPRLLPLLDYETIRRHAKALVGYSDLTALLNVIQQRTGLITFHGPNAASNVRPYTLDALRRVLFSSAAIGTLTNPEKEEQELVNRSYRVLTLRGGRARGRLVGGNLTLIAALMGTPWELATDGAILLLEDVEEELYRVDRMLTQLAQGGKLGRLAGVVFGYCTDCPIGEGPSFSLEELLHQHLGSLGVPAMAGLAFGHVGKMLTLPLGLPATLDADAGTLSFDEAAVA